MKRRQALAALGVGAGITLLRATPARASLFERYLTDFGPVGTGDDSQTFADALASIPLGGTILVPNGDYRAVFSLGSDQRIEGESVGGARVIGQVRTALNARRAGLESLTVDGLNSATPNVVGVLLNGCSSSSVRNVQILGFRGTPAQPGSGLRIDASPGGQGYFNHCEHVDSNGSGFGFRVTAAGGNWPNGNVFDNCGASSNTFDGYRIEGPSTAGIRITGGQSSYNGGDGIQIDGFSHFIWGPWLENNRGVGLRNNCGSPRSSVWAFIAAGNTQGDVAGLVPSVLYLQGPTPHFT